MSGQPEVDGLLRACVPRAVGAVAARYGDFADAEDAVQQALVAATGAWPEHGLPDDPLAWLVRVASRRLIDQRRRDEARRRREDALSASPPVEAPSGHDDTLALLCMCCHPSLTPGAAIPLTLRAVAGLTTRQLAAAFVVPEATMAQRISRAKAKIKASGEPFALPPPSELGARLRSVRHVLYLMFNEGYTATVGDDLLRPDLTDEAIRLTRTLAAVAPDDPDDPETEGLLALMLLTDARRPARCADDGELIPLAEQDRRRWDRERIAEGVAVLADAVRRGRLGEYQLQAAVAAAHDRAPSHGATDWAEIAAIYGLLERMTGNPVVTLNRAVAVAMADNPAAGLALLADLDDVLGDHHRLYAVRAHIRELAGDVPGAVEDYRAAAARTANLREQRYLQLQAARLAHPAVEGAPA